MRKWTLTYGNKRRILAAQKSVFQQQTVFLFWAFWPGKILRYACNYNRAMKLYISSLVTKAGLVALFATAYYMVYCTLVSTTSGETNAWKITLTRGMETVRKAEGQLVRFGVRWGNPFSPPSSTSLYCNRRNFSTRFNFVHFVLLAKSTKISSIRKPCTYTSVCDTALKVRKFIAYESSRTLEYEIFYAYENFCDYSTQTLRRIAACI